MNENTDVMDAELTRRLTDLAATTTTDPGAWDRISERTATLSPVRGRSGPSPRWLLAIAAAAVLLLGVAAVLLRDDRHDRARTVDQPPSPPPSADDGTEPPTPDVSPPPTARPPASPNMTGTGGATPTAPGSSPLPRDACPPEVGQACEGTDAGDVDGDGRPDMVAVYTTGGGAVGVRVVYADGAVDSDEVPGLPEAARLLGVTDMDGDGREEIAFQSDQGAAGVIGGFMGTARTGRLHMVGFGQPQSLLYAGGRSIAGFSCRDVDGDGTRELVTTGISVTSGTSVDVTTEVFRWQGDVLSSQGPGTQTVATEDTDGNGFPDSIPGTDFACGDVDMNVG
jgi:hypothetical protein